MNMCQQQRKRERSDRVEHTFRRAIILALMNCHPEEGGSPTKDLLFGGSEASAGEQQILRLRRAFAQDDNCL